MTNMRELYREFIRDTGGHFGNRKPIPDDATPGQLFEGVLRAPDAEDLAIGFVAWLKCRGLVFASQNPPSDPANG